MNVAVKRFDNLEHHLFRFANGIAGRGRKQRLSVLIYHRVLPETDWMRPAIPTTKLFSWQMATIARHFNVLPLSEAIHRLAERSLPSRALSITFDDGYADNLHIAAPVLQQYNLPATVFVSTGYLDGGVMWNDKIIEAIRYYPDNEINLEHLELPVYPLTGKDARRIAAHDIIGRCKYLSQPRREEIADTIAAGASSTRTNLMLTKPQLVELHQAGVEIGGHTVSHPILTELSLDQARTEIQDGKAELEALLDTSMRLFAYPNGRRGIDYNDEHVSLVKEAGFEGAVITNTGVSVPETDPFQIPRFTPWDKTSIRFLMRMAWNASRFESNP